MITERKPKIGDHVVIHALFCEADKMEGDIIGICAEDSLPYMVRLSNYREWPFELRELELCDIDGLVYAGGWV